MEETIAEKSIMRRYCDAYKTAFMAVAAYPTFQRKRGINPRKGQSYGNFIFENFSRGVGLMGTVLSLPGAVVTFVITKDIEGSLAILSSSVPINALSGVYEYVRFRRNPERELREDNYLGHLNEERGFP